MDESYPKPVWNDVNIRLAVDNMRTIDVNDRKSGDTTDNGGVEELTDDGSPLNNVSQESVRISSKCSTPGNVDGKQYAKSLENGWTPLHCACFDGDELRVAALLHQSTIDLNGKDKNGETPLHLACKLGHEGLVDLLLRNHALTNEKSNNGATPLSLARSNGHEAIVRQFKFLRTTEITAQDKVLRNLIRRTAAVSDVYLGSIDAMSDNLIAEALRAGISVDKIAHAMFSCEESHDFLREVLDESVLMDASMRDSMLNVLQKAMPVDYRKYTDALLCCENGLIPVDTTECSAFLVDLVDYVQVRQNLFLVQQRGSLTAHKQKNGVYRIEQGKMKWAIKPHQKGISYLLHKSCEKPTEGRRFHGQETVDRLIGLGCDDVVAWRLLAAAVDHRVDGSFSLLRDDTSDKIVHTFSIVSRFRTELHDRLRQIQHGQLDKRLMGTKDQLEQIRKEPFCNIGQTFVLSRDVYETVQRQTRLCAHHPQAQMAVVPLEPFTESFLDSDALDTHMDLLIKIITNAKSSDLIRGYNKHTERHSDAWSMVVLAALSGNNLDSPLLTSTDDHENQYVYQDDFDARRFYTPFSKLMILVTRSFEDFKASPVQHPRNNENSLINSIAFRAALDYDMLTGEFGPENRPDFDVVNFINDTSRRFGAWYAKLPETIYVSFLTALCNEIAEIFGASSPWLVREMVSRCILLGAKEESAALKSEPLDSYGKMERKMKEKKIKTPRDCDKILCFDLKINIMGVMCCVGEHGKVVLLDDGNCEWEAEIRFKNLGRAYDSESALRLLEERECIYLVTVQRDHGLFFENSTRVVFAMDAFV